MSCGPEQGRAVFLEERRAVRIGGHGVGLLGLEGEGDVVLDSVFLLVLCLDFRNGGFEEFLVLGGDGDDEFDAAVRIAHIRLSFNEMLCKGRAYFVRVAVEFQHPLGLLAVAKSVVLKKLCGCLAGVVWSLSEHFGVVESEVFELRCQFADGVVLCLEACKDVLEHSGSGSGSGYELAAAGGLCGAAVVFGGLCGFGSQNFNSASGGGGGDDVEPGETFLDALEFGSDFSVVHTCVSL